MKDLFIYYQRIMILERDILSIIKSASRKNGGQRRR
jgi:hypothetical protein